MQYIEASDQQDHVAGHSVKCVYVCGLQWWCDGYDGGCICCHVDHLRGGIFAQQNDAGACEVYAVSVYNT